ncbi:polysaccharide pyruvyl transferase family protein [Ciceribacter sp. L1K23]|uniref:polysaccharide pyruvyl transferase family protein n=1 Tax=Ciceribacter sp. L1K23 TaxID=2820276 RepID=UPI001B828A73|nr:polysaccharide pyruvyl transferase family protein [Ciceribacter sp. L1K23]MBR0557931.1 polysaccharide pyruvyl transferase family protein [Ciceribacter sp. L1K23]
MKLYLYRGAEPNFGDELNSWLLPRVFPNFFSDDEQNLFLGIGSILFDHHPTDPTKIVFGSGYGGYTKPPVLDEKWKVYCVRGPRTAACLNLDSSKVAADTAVLLNTYGRKSVPKRFKFSFMPHWESLHRGRWSEASEAAGVHFLDPRRDVEEILLEIQQSEVVIAEAMHGAIVSDALRVPWVPILPFHKSHHFKWFDWAEALNIQLRPVQLSPSSTHEAWVQKTGRGGNRFRQMLGPAIWLSDRYYFANAVKSLVNATLAQPSLSSDAAMATAVEKLSSASEVIKRDYSQA